MHRVMNDTLADAACGFHCGLFSVSLLRGRLVRPAMHRVRNDGLAGVVRVFYRGMNGLREYGSLVENGYTACSHTGAFRFEETLHTACSRTRAF